MLDILNAREDRWNLSNELLEKYDHPLTLITLNIPGPEKSKNKYIEAHAKLEKDFIKYMKSFSVNIIYKKIKVTADGPESYIIFDKNGKMIKRKSIEFEEKHPLGRIGDIDIRDQDRNWSRSDFNLSSRKCLVCNDLARNCIVSGKHELGDILNKIDGVIESFLE